MASNVNDNDKVNKAGKGDNDKSESDKSQSSLVSKLPGIKFFNEKVKKTSNITIDNTKTYWDPLSSSDWDLAGPPGAFVSTRVRRDLSSLFKEPLPGIFAIPDEKNFCLVHGLVLGPFGTPYEGGFFHFVVRFGPSYPIHPPRVRLLTGGGRVRFNPNLYSNGKVCLSILGTWSGPVWSPALNLGSLLLSIQSLLNDKPYYNEPGFKAEHYRGESDRYNIYLTHETIRISVCYQLEQYYGKSNSTRTKLLPSELAEVMRETFLDLFTDYIDVCNKYKKYDGEATWDPVFKCSEKVVYSFTGLIERLKKIKELLSDKTSEKNEIEDGENSASSLSDEENGKKHSEADSVTGVDKSIKMKTTNEAHKTDVPIDEEDDNFFFNYDDYEDDDVNEEGDPEGEKDKEDNYEDESLDKEVQKKGATN